MHGGRGAETLGTLKATRLVLYYSPRPGILPSFGSILAPLFLLPVLLILFAVSVLFGGG